MRHKSAPAGVAGVVIEGVQQIGLRKGRAAVKAARLVGAVHDGRRRGAGRGGRHVLLCLQQEAAAGVHRTHRLLFDAVVLVFSEDEFTSIFFLADEYDVISHSSK